LVTRSSAGMAMGRRYGAHVGSAELCGEGGCPDNVLRLGES
jgi:hypothetical protein